MAHGVYDGEYDVTASGPVSSWYWQRLIKFFKSVAGFHWTFRGFDAVGLVTWRNPSSGTLLHLFTLSPKLFFWGNPMQPVEIGQAVVITHWHIIAELVGCFQRRLFISLFVNTITSEWLNVGWWNLAVRCTVHKSRPSSNLGSKVKSQDHQRQKKKKCGSLFRSLSLVRSLYEAFFSGAVFGGAATLVGKSAHWYRIGWNLLSLPSASYMLLYILILGI